MASITASSSLQPISSQAPVLGEKYYFSKAPISNDVAKAAAETVMAIASSALNASKCALPLVTVSAAPAAASASPAAAVAITVKEQPQEISPAAAAAAVLQPVTAVTKSVTVLSFVDKSAKVDKVEVKEPLELQTYLQAKAMKAQEEAAKTQRLSGLTIERVPHDPMQGPRNVTMNVMDMPNSGN